MDHFVATSVANPLLGGGMSAIMLPGVIFKTESICISQGALVFCWLADINPSFFHFLTGRLAFVYQDLLCKDDHMDGGRAHFGVN